MKTYVIGDTHGGAKALQQCLFLVNFDFENDRLICLGDICDGWSQTKEIIDILLKIKNLILLKGNHDDWFLKWCDRNLSKMSYLSWIGHGGRATIQSLTGIDPGQYSTEFLDSRKLIGNIDTKYIDFLKSAKDYHIIGKDFFCHAGVNFWSELEENTSEDFLWDREFVYEVREQKKLPFINSSIVKDWVKEYTFWIGHTPTISFGNEFTGPQFWANAILMDTGAAFTGRLTIMNLETREFFQSDKLVDLYPKEMGRNRK